MEKITVNERLKMLRTENGLTQTELAKALHIGQTTVAAYERSHDPNLYSLIAYADYFECTLDYLAGREDAPLPYALTQDERELVRLFRTLKPAAKEFALKQLETLSVSLLNRT